MKKILIIGFIGFVLFVSVRIWQATRPCCGLDALMLRAEEQAKETKDTVPIILDDIGFEWDYFIYFYNNETFKYMLENSYGKSDKIQDYDVSDDRYSFVFFDNNKIVHHHIVSYSERYFFSCGFIYKYQKVPPETVIKIQRCLYYDRTFNRNTPIYGAWCEKKKLLYLYTDDMVWIKNQKMEECK
jgi:hypothetical protein